MNTSTTTYEKT